MTRYLINLTDAELAARLAKIEEMGKATAAKLASGQRGHVVSQHVVRGRWADSYSTEVALNVQRSAWRQTKEEINFRRAEAQAEA